METGLILLGCACAALAVHPFLTYPLSLALLARVRPRPLAPIEEGLVPSKPHSPATGDGGESGGGGSVALCVCAYNEARVIAPRRRTCSPCVPREPELEILVYVDAATDSHRRDPARYADRITVVASPTGTARRTG